MASTWAKHSCSVVGLDERGTIVVRRRMRRDGVIAFAASWRLHNADRSVLRRPSYGAVAGGVGHKVRLLSPEYVRPYVKAQKNDHREAEAIAEAATRPIVRFVELEEQLDVQTLHRARDRLIAERTSLTNQIRNLLLERRHIVAQGHARLRHLARRTAGLRLRYVEPAHDVPARRYAHTLGRNWTGASPPLTLSSLPWPGP
ncbi:transposase [Bradyrhizobium sp. ISRA464]|uniref:IS110 family transposase n=1 Tax=Bradyrhizobium sp. ISRA464 TaxID=2866200 RepID=UPI0032B02EEB